MFTSLVNLFWIVVSVVLAIVLLCSVLLLALMLAYAEAKGMKEAHQVQKPGSQRKYRRPYFQNHVA